MIIIECFEKIENKKKPKATKKNLNARAEKGSLWSTIGLVVIKADDHNKIKIKGYILIILGFIKKNYLHSIRKFSLICLWKLSLYV